MHRSLPPHTAHVLKAEAAHHVPSCSEEIVAEAVQIDSHRCVCDCRCCQGGDGSLSSPANCPSHVQAACSPTSCTINASAARTGLWLMQAWLAEHVTNKNRAIVCSSRMCIFSPASEGWPLKHLGVHMALIRSSNCVRGAWLSAGKGKQELRT